MSGTVQTKAQLLAGVASGQAPGSITPVQMQNIVASTVNVAPGRNVQSAAYTLTLTDLGGVVEMSSASPQTLTIPTNASVAFPIGSKIRVYQANTGTVSIAGAGGVTVVSKATSNLASIYAEVELTQRSTNVWYLSGELQPFAATNPQPLYEFLNSFGVNTHIGLGDAASLSTNLFADLQAVGAKWIRDSNTSVAAQISQFQGVVAAGLKIDLITQASSGTLTTASQVSNFTSAMASGTSPLIAVEGVNEPDNQVYIYNGVTITQSGVPGWHPVSQFTSDMWGSLHATAALINIPLWHISNNGGDPLDDGLQFLSVPYGYNHYTQATSGSTALNNGTLTFSGLPTTGATGIVPGHYIYGTNIASGATVVSATSTSVVMSPVNSAGTIASGESIRFGARMPDGATFSDVINIHYYSMQNNQQAMNCVGALYGANDGPDSTIGVNYGTTWGGGYSGYTTAQYRLLPKVLSETGYDTRNAGASTGSVDQATAGKNILNNWLSAWVEGFKYYCVYSLYDTGFDAPALWGLFTSPGVIKTTGTYVGNFNTILADANITKATSATYDSLGFAVTNLPSPGGLYNLFQRSDGTYFLVLWNNVSNWNYSTGLAVAVTGTNVTVTFARSGTISTYDPTVGTSAQTTATGNSVTVNLADHPRIISFI